MDMFSYLMGKSSGGGKGALVPIVVDELPEIGEAGKLYLVPKEEVETDDEFDEYIYVNDDWELLGTAKIDISGKQDKMQFSTMPSANADNLGKIVQYIGNTNQNYTKGYFYICISDGAGTPTYSWTNINVNSSEIHIIEKNSYVDLLGLKKGIYVCPLSSNNQTSTFNVSYSPKSTDNHYRSIQPIDGVLKILVDVTSDLADGTIIATYDMAAGGTEVRTYSIYVAQNEYGISEYYRTNFSFLSASASQNVLGTKYFSDARSIGNQEHVKVAENFIDRRYLDGRIFDINKLLAKGITYYISNATYQQNDIVYHFNNKIYKAKKTTSRYPTITSDWDEVTNEYEDCKYATLGDISAESYKFIECKPNNVLTVPKIEELDTGIYYIGSKNDEELGGYIDILDENSPNLYKRIHGFPYILLFVAKEEYEEEDYVVKRANYVFTYNEIESDVEQTIIGSGLYDIILSNGEIVDGTCTYSITATKKYVDDAVAGAGGDITNLENRNFFVIKGFADEDKQRLLDIINYSIETGITPILAIRNGNRDFEGVLLEPTNKIVANTSQIYFTFSNTTSPLAGYGLSMSNKVSHLKLTNLQWENDKLINFSWAADQYNRQFALSTTNTTAYTPTSQYHPATKGYVDSAIASAITDALGGDY